MPTYEYVCKTCGENFDVHQSFSDKPLKKHAACGGELQKVFHARGIVFKGGGFYATDSKPSTKPEKKAAKKDDKKSDSKSDSKPKGKEKAKSTSSSSDKS
jgi:putative FmdB family regulatory protein